MAQAIGTVLRTGVGSNFKFQDFVPAIWTGRLLANMQGKTALKNYVTTEYEGEIKGFGDTVYVPGVDRISVSAYDSGSDITYGKSDSNLLTIVVDHAKYWATKIDDVEKAQSKPEFLNELMKEAAWALSKNTEAYLYQKFITAAQATAADGFGQKGGTGSTVYALDMSTAGAVYNGLVDLGTRMDDLETPADGRFIVVPSFVYAALLKDDRFVGASAYAAQKAITQREVGQIAGFTVHTMPRQYFKVGTASAPYTGGFVDLDNNVTATGTAVSDKNLLASGATGASGADDYAMIAGAKGAVAYVEQLAKTENVRLQAQFADGVRGLHVYGSGVLRPQWCHVLYADDSSVADA